MEIMRRIPSVDDLLSMSPLQEILEEYQRGFVVSLVRQAVQEVRDEILKGEKDYEKIDLASLIVGKVKGKLERIKAGTLRQVINGTGVVLHTNLGRAPLGYRAVEKVQEMSCRYNNLEFNLKEGERGSRYEHVEDLLTLLTGAEAGLVVNNNAAAVLLALTAVARQGEVIVSRGQLVEIGGAFRIPEVMKLSGAQLVEVGTTNRTYLDDYARAINDKTTLLFAAHTSNYKIIGFSQEVELASLVNLGKKHSLPVMQDLGSGILLELTEWGLKDEPTVQQCVASGVDIITFSGDKLLGGPQAGIIVGRKSFIEAMKKNQLLRALRVDKLTIAALEETLIQYLKNRPEKEIPILRMLTSSDSELYQRAERLCSLLRDELKGSEMVDQLQMVHLEDMVGGGAYPALSLPGYGVQIKFNRISLEKAAETLRLMDPAIVTRRKGDTMLISVRTLFPEDLPIIAKSLAKISKEHGPDGEQPGR